MASDIVRVGVLSDTHGYLDPCVPELLAGVDHILHAGDVGYLSVIHELEQVAPVTAVLGNTDSPLGLRETEVVTLGGRSFLVHHIVDPDHLSGALEQRIDRDQPQAIIFGHTHRASETWHGGRLFLNPGYSGRPRYNTQRSVARLELGLETLTVTFLKLEG